MDARLSGYGFALASAALVGLVNVVSKHALTLGAEPIPLVAVAYVGAAFLLAPYAVRFRPGSWKDATVVTLSALAGAVVAPAALFLGLVLTTAVTASLLVNLEVMFTALLAWAFLRERFAAREGGALLAIALGGVAVAAGPDLVRGSLPSLESLAGAGLVAVAALSWSVDSILTTPLTRRYALRPLLAAKVLVGAIVLGAVSLFLERGGVTWAVVPHVAAIAVLGIIASILFLFAAFRVVGATRSIVLFSTAGLWGAFGGRLLLGEPLTWPHLAGGLLMVVGVVALARAGEAVMPVATPP